MVINIDQDPFACDPDATVVEPSQLNVYVFRDIYF